jgi:pSer/pThr/pTyr-binding forkhead associated (FHA) protein
MSAERVVVEGLDDYGRVRWRERLLLNDGRRTFTVGRSLDADVTLDDPHAAALHVSIEIAHDGRLLASDLGSLNGLIVRGKRCCNVRGLELPGNTLQIGRTHLRVRTAHERLEPEKPYASPASPFAWGSASIAALAALASGSQLVYARWVGAPRDLAISIATSLLVAVPIAAGWVAVWGLLSRVMQGEWRWLRHCAIFLGVCAAFVAVMGILDLGGFVLALPPSESRYTWIGAIALGCALFLHLLYASDLSARRAALVACGIPLLLAMGSQWMQERSQSRDVNYIGSRTRIYPPALRLRPSETLEGYFNRATGLRELANRRLTEALADEPAKDGEN